MRPSRLGFSIAITTVALALAAAGAAANLHLLAPQSSRNGPLVLGTTVVPPQPDRDPPASAPEDIPTSTTDTGPPITSTIPVGPTTSTTQPVAAPAPTRFYEVGQAGTVVLSVRQGLLVVDAIRPASGWSYSTEKQTGDEVEIAFRSSEHEASISARLENGQIRVQIEGSGEPADD
jgi:hypothetical protein